MGSEGVVWAMALQNMLLALMCISKSPKTLKREMLIWETLLYFCAGLKVGEIEFTQVFNLYLQSECFHCMFTQYISPTSLLCIPTIYVGKS